MISIDDLHALADSRLADAEVLAAATRHAGAIYLCGYAVELVLKARICRTLGWLGWPDAGEFGKLNSFKTHDLATLLHVSGVELMLKADAELAAGWLAVAEWDPERLSSARQRCGRGRCNHHDRKHQKARYISEEMTDELIAHLDRVRRQLENEKGEFSFFALVRRRDSTDLELLIAAPWLRQEKLRGLAQVASRVYSDDLPKTWWSKLARIVTLDEADADNRALMAALGPARELIIHDQPNVSGPAIEHAWVMKNDRRADEDHDVIAHYVKETDARTGTSRDRWIVFQGPEMRAEASTRDEAIEIAKRLSDKTGRPAWLLDESGYPLKWIGRPNSPRPQDVVMYFIDFVKPLPLKGWYVVREGREEFSDTDDDRALQRACTIARDRGVRCFRVRTAEPEEVDCSAVR